MAALLSVRRHVLVLLDDPQLRFEQLAGQPLALGLDRRIVIAGVRGAAEVVGLVGIGFQVVHLPLLGIGALGVEVAGVLPLPLADAADAVGCVDRRAVGV